MIFTSMIEADIVSIPLSKLQKITTDFNEQSLTELLQQYPKIGKINKTNFVLNTNLTININQNNRFIAYLSVLLQVASSKAPLLLITKI